MLCHNPQGPEPLILALVLNPHSLNPIAPEGSHLCPEVWNNSISTVSTASAARFCAKGVRMFEEGFREREHAGQIRCGPKHTHTHTLSLSLTHTHTHTRARARADNVHSHALYPTHSDRLPWWKLRCVQW